MPLARNATSRNRFWIQQATAACHVAKGNSEGTTQRKLVQTYFRKRTPKEELKWNVESFFGSSMAKTLMFLAKSCSRDC